MQMKPTEEMIGRFLQWKLPENFSPDAGISFKPTFNDHLDPPMRHEPTGTNLLDHQQAKDMLEFVLETIPDSSAAAPTEIRYLNIYHEDGKAWFEWYPDQELADKFGQKRILCIRLKTAKGWEAVTVGAKVKPQGSR
jgi:hypothetical protein